MCALKHNKYIFPKFYFFKSFNMQFGSNNIISYKFGRKQVEYKQPCFCSCSCICVYIYIYDIECKYILYRYSSQTRFKGNGNIFLNRRSGWKKIQKGHKNEKSGKEKKGKKSKIKKTSKRIFNTGEYTFRFKYEM